MSYETLATSVDNLVISNAELTAAAQATISASNTAKDAAEASADAAQASAIAAAAQIAQLAAPTGSTLVGFKSNKTNSVSRTVANKLDDLVSVKDFGAVGDGTTNDTAAFTALESNYQGQTIDLGGKTYVVNSDFVGNTYVNGRLKIGTTTLTKSTIETSIGAFQEDFSANSALRYDIQEINGSTTSRGAQAFAFDERGRSMYLMESDRLHRFPMDGDDLVYPIDASAAGGTALGHQGLAIEYLESGIKFWTTSSVGGRYAARVSYTANSPITDAEVYELFDGNNVFANSTSCTPTVSTCGRFVMAHGTRYGSYITVIRVFDLKSMVAGGPGDYTKKWLYEWETQGLVDANNPLQGLACDGTNVYCIAGGTGFTETVNKRLFTFTLKGQLIRAQTNITIGRDLALLDANSTRYEPEGLSIVNSSNGPILMVGILSGDPGMRRFRIFATGAGKPVIARSLDLVGNHKARIGASVSAGRDYLAVRARYDLVAGSGSNWYGLLDPTQPGGIADFTNSLTRRVTNIEGTTIFKADSGVAVLQTDGPASGQHYQFFRNGVQYGAINVSTVDIGIHALNGSAVRFATGAAGVYTGTTRWLVENGGNITPFVDATYNIGSASLRVATYYGSTSSISTSDETCKEDITNIDDVILDAWSEVKYQRYKFKEAIALKGEDAARLHFGLIAQRVKEIFESKGLDPFTFGLLCYDEWDEQQEILDDDGNVVQAFAPAGNRYGIRYEEALVLEAALMRRTTDRLQQKLDLLESKISS